MKAPGDNGTSEPGTTPRFEYFLETVGQPVTPEDPLWTRQLPMSRQAFSEPSSSHPGSGMSLSVGDYFQAVRAFLEGAGREALVRSCPEWGTDASAVRIFLAKHGEYYHPARVEAEIKGRSFGWVVNVAVSAAGKTLLSREYNLLERLGREFPAGYTPDVYAAGWVDAGRGRELAMFLGQWLFGFHEFHLTRNTPHGGLDLVLWDPESGPRRLDASQRRAVYYKIARILTHYLNLETFEGIAAWHHAAGDFVVRLREEDAEVRLISVRDYRPLFHARPASFDGPDAVSALLEALLVFLLNVSVRTRLDRLDGTGELVWSDPEAVASTVSGVLDGLSEKPARFDLPLPMDLLFKRFLAACREEDLLGLCLAIAAKIDSAGGAMFALLETCMKEHAATLMDDFLRVHQY
jgi:hypothetical protein